MSYDLHLNANSDKQNEIDTKKKTELSDEENYSNSNFSQVNLLMKSILERVTDGFIALDTNWVYTYVNQKAAELLNRKKPEDLIGKHIWTEFPEAIDLTFYQLCYKAMETQEMQYIEGEFLPWNRWFENRIYPSPEGLTIYFSEITNKMLSAIHLAQEEKFTQSLLKLAFALETAKNYEQIMTKANEEIKTNLAYSNIYLSLFSEDLKYFQLLDAEGSNKSLLSEIKNEQGIPVHGDLILEELLESKEILIIEDAQNDPRANNEILKTLQNRTMICIPIQIFENRCAVLGVGTFGQEGVRVPNDLELEYLYAIASNIAQTLDRLHTQELMIQSELALKESEAMLKLINENTPDVILKINKLGEIQYINRVIPTMTKEEVIGSTIFNWVPPAQHSILQNGLNSAFNEMKSYEYESEGPSPDGTKHHYLTRINPIIIDEKADSAIYIATDITERKIIELALINSEEKHRNFIESLPDGVYRSTADGKFVQINQAMVDILGYDSISELLQVDIVKDLYFSEEDREEIKLDQKNTEMSIFRLKKKGGGSVWVEDHGKYVLDNEGNILFNEGVMRDITSRIKVENELIEQKSALEIAYQKLTENEDKFRSLFEHSRDGIILCDMDRNILDCNQTFAEMLGYTQEEIKKLKIKDITPEKWKSQVLDDKRENEMYLHGFTNTYEKEYLRKDGIAIPVEISVFLYHKKNDQKDYMWGVVRDISNRKKELKELQEAREHFETIFHSSPDTINITRLRDQVITHVNKIYTEILGYTAEELIGNTSAHFNIWVDDNERSAFIKKIAETGSAYSQYALIRRKDGSQLYATLASKLITIDGEAHIISVGRDSTAQKESEDKVKILTEALDQCPVSIILTDTKGQIHYVNKKFEDVTGYSFSDVLNHNPNMLSSGFHDRNFYQHLWKTVLNGNTWKGEIKNKRKNGEEYWENAIISPIFDAKDNIIQLLAVKEDITLQKIKEEELRKLNEELFLSHIEIENNLKQKNILIEELTATKAKLETINSEKDKFFSIIAHDLKSPFSGFLGLTKIIAEEFQRLSFGEIQSITQSLQESASNLYKLLENLLEWTKMQRGLTSFHPEPCDIFYIIEQNVGISKEFAKQKQILIVNNIPNEINLNIDVAMFNTVIRNLLSNAIKFTPRNGTIEFSGHTTSEKVRILIKDSGIGMSKEIQSQIFSIDNKTSRPGTEGEPSTGLGLLLCKEFIETNGGKILVESEIGKGTTFILEF